MEITSPGSLIDFSAEQDLDPKQPSTIELFSGALAAYRSELLSVDSAVRQRAAPELVSTAQEQQ